MRIISVQRSTGKLIGSLHIIWLALWRPLKHAASPLKQSIGYRMCNKVIRIMREHLESDGQKGGILTVRRIHGLHPEPALLQPPPGLGYIKPGTRSELFDRGFS